MPATIPVGANISPKLSAIFTTVAEIEERPKSYYIRKGLETFFKQRLEDLEDYRDAKQAHDAFVASGEEGVPFEKMKQELNL